MRVVQALVVFACCLTVSAAMAQRGVGEPGGVARQTAKPKVISLTGEVVEVKTEACQTSTGRSPLGTHLVMKTPDAKTVEVHLGPPDAVEFVAKELSRGKKVRVEVFRTQKMEKGQYVARSLKYGGRTVELRDETLRPVWAGGQGTWRGAGRGGPAGWGRGAGYGRRGGREWRGQGAWFGRSGSCWWQSSGTAAAGNNPSE